MVMRCLIYYHGKLPEIDCLSLRDGKITSLNRVSYFSLPDKNSNLAAHKIASENRNRSFLILLFFMRMESLYIMN